MKAMNENHDHFDGENGGRNLWVCRNCYRNNEKWAHWISFKAFSWYGNNSDTHIGIAHDIRTYENFINNDFKPFEAGIKAGADAVLVSHNIVESIDSQNPASLSEKIHTILREELQLDGVIMTDDLFMEAITDYIGDEKSAVLAILAGNDLICCTNFEI